MTRSELTIELVEAMTEADRARVGAWFCASHVSRWWGDAQDRLRQFDATPAGNHAIITCEGEPVGYMRWETVDSEALQAVGLDEIPEGSFDVDLFIGESEMTGRGIGPRAVAILCDRLREDTPAPLAGFCTSVDNKPAQTALRKAGCINLSTYDDPAYGPCHVYVKWLR